LTYLHLPTKVMCAFALETAALLVQLASLLALALPPQLVHLLRFLREILLEQVV